MIKHNIQTEIKFKDKIPIFWDGPKVQDHFQDTCVMQLIPIQLQNTYPGSEESHTGLRRVWARLSAWAGVVSCATFCSVRHSDTSC